MWVLSCDSAPDEFGNCTGVQSWIELASGVSGLTTIDEANELIATILLVFVLAWLFRQLVDFVLNRR